MPNLADLPVLANVAIFLIAGAAVWIAGTRLSYFADAIARRTGAGQAALGVLLLGGVTSLPEIAVTGTAATSGDAALAVNNLLGGFAVQVVVLALADIAIRRSALTTAVPDPIVLLQGAWGMLLVSLLLAGIVAGDVAVLGAGAWSWGILLVFVYAVRTITRAEGHLNWEVVGEPPAPEIDRDEPEVERSAARLYGLTALTAAVILVMGAALALSGEALAEQTGLGSSFFGAVFVALSTSLPEISTVLAAVRLGRYVLAVSDIFGTNLFDIAVIVLVDLFYPGGAVLNEVGEFSIVAGLMGIAVTGIYVIGLIERRDPAIGGVGIDTLAVVAVYLGGLALLFQLR